MTGRIFSRWLRASCGGFWSTPRARKAVRSGRPAGVEQVAIDDVEIAGAAPSTDFLALNDALDALETVDARKCRVVEMRFFAGMREEEVAVALHMSIATVKRDWRLAKAWLARELGETERVAN